MPLYGEGERQQNISLIIIQNSGKNSPHVAGLEGIFIAFGILPVYS